MVNELSSSISSSNSTSSPVSRPSALISRRASLGRLKLVLLLDVPLPGLPADADLPALEMEVRREDGPEVSAPVGESERTGDPGVLSCEGRT